MIGKYKTVPAVAVFFSLLTGFSYASPPPEEIDYFACKQRGDYKKALEILAAWNGKISEPSVLELNAFRISELVSQPELLDLGVEVLESLKKHDPVRNNPLVGERIDLFLNDLYLKKGDIERSDRIVRSLGFNGFFILGPFNNRSLQDFETEHSPERSWSPRKSHEGKSGAVTWHYLPHDRFGTIDINDIASDVKDTIYYLYGEFEVPSEGGYYMMVGRTGFTDIWMDGTKILSHRERHDFFRDQYMISLSLMRGSHRILVKTGDSRGRIRFSMRMKGRDGSIILLKKTITGNGNGTLAGNSHSSNYFPTLDKFYSARGNDMGKAFYAAYLFSRTRIGNESNGIVRDLVSGIPPGDPLFSPANYYSAAAQTNPERRSYYLHRAFDGDRSNMEALYGLVRLAVGHRRFVEARRLMDSFPAHASGFPFYRVSEALLYHEKKWRHAELKTSFGLDGSAYPSTGLALRAAFYSETGEYGKAAALYRKLSEKNRTDKSYASGLLKCYYRMGDETSYEKELLMRLSVFPNSIHARLMLAKSMTDRLGPGPALPVLSSALSIAPYNQAVLKEMGHLYRALGREDLAAHYFAKSHFINPDDRNLSSLLRFNNKEKSVLDEIGFTADIGVLLKESDGYSGEPAVILLSENLTEFRENGSYEKRVRRIIRINTKESFDDFKNQYVLFDPKSESIDNLRCYLTNGSGTTAISEKFEKSLSDPASRLYYDLKTVIVPVHGISEGSIIDFSYTVKNMRGGIFRNYVSDRYAAGSVYRTMKRIIAVTGPRQMGLSFHSDKINERSIRRYTLGRNDVYRVTLHNTPPIRKEPHMPNLFNIMPSLYVSNLDSWGSLSRWYASLMQGKTAASDDMIRDAVRICAGLDTPEKKISAIYRHVTGEIRYVGFEFGLGGIQPRSVDITYHTKMGDCKDIALVLVVMLRAVGIDAYIALLRTRDNGTANTGIPSLEDFNHAICYVNYGGGIFIDGTTTNCGITELPSEDRDVVALVIHDRGSGSSRGYSLIRTSGDFYKKNRIEIQNEMKLNEDGSMIVDRKIIKEGSMAPVTRTSLMLSEKMKLSVLNEYWSKIYPGTVISDYKVLNTEPDMPVAYQYRVTVPSYSRRVEKDLVFEPFCLKSDYNSDYCTLKKREFPVVFEYPVEIVTINAVQFPEGYRCAKLPEKVGFSGSKTGVTFRYTMHENGLSAESIIAIKGYSIGPAEYNELRQFAGSVNAAENGLVILEKTGEGPLPDATGN